MKDSLTHSGNNYLLFLAKLSSSNHVNASRGDGKQHHPGLILHITKRPTNYLTNPAYTFEQTSLMLTKIVLIKPFLYRRHQLRALLHQHEP
jgi:hypothetical protein